MSRTAEAMLVFAATGLVVFGVLLVDFAQGSYLDRRTALTILVFIAAFGALLTTVHSWASRSVPYLLPPVAVLTAVGFVIIYRLDYGLSGRQSWWITFSAGLAALALFLLRKGGVGSLRTYRWHLLAVSLFMLVLSAIPATSSLPDESAWWWATELLLPPGGAARLLLVIFLATYMTGYERALASGGPTIRGFQLPEPRSLLLIGMALIAAIGVLLYHQDLGASLLLFGLFPIMFYMATNRAAYLATGFGAYALGLFGALVLSPSLREVISAWLRPWAGDTAVGSHIAQTLFALAAGGAAGTGLGLGTPGLVPAAAASHLFAALGEELGLAGSAVMLGAYVLLVTAGFGIALRARDPFRKLLAGGLSLLLGLQGLLVLAGSVRLLPPGALPVPFMSYGGSSLVTAFLLLALLVRVSHEEQA